jgi:hypothetical protein
MPLFHVTKQAQGIVLTISTELTRLGRDILVQARFNAYNIE